MSLKEYSKLLVIVIGTVSLITVIVTTAGNYWVWGYRVGENEGDIADVRTEVELAEEKAELLQLEFSTHKVSITVQLDALEETVDKGFDRIYDKLDEGGTW